MGLQCADVHEFASTRLREAGQQYTTARRELLQLLVDNGRPASIAEMLALNPNLTQSSLYRNAAILETVGVVRRVVGYDEVTRYEPSTDIIGHHHHMICTECGMVEDFLLASGAEEALRRALQSVHCGTGFQPTSHQVDLFGMCSVCARGSGAPVGLSSAGAPGGV